MPRRVAQAFHFLRCMKFSSPEREARKPPPPTTRRRDEWTQVICLRVVSKERRVLYVEHEAGHHNDGGPAGSHGGEMARRGISTTHANESLFRIGNSHICERGGEPPENGLSQEQSSDGFQVVHQDTSRLTGIVES